MKNVIIRKGDRAGGPGLLEQLRVFGITVREVETAEEIERLVCLLGDAILVADSQRLGREPAFAGEILALKRRFGDSIQLLYYADRDDFDMRLRSVRAGGEGYFILPMDAYDLAEKIDCLFKEREAPPYRVLIVDDDPDQVAYNATILKAAGMTTVAATDPRQVIPLLVESKPEIILMDMYMPGCTGAELAAIVRQNEAFAAVPIVFLSVEKDLEKQITAMMPGCDGFLEKPIKPEHLVASVTVRAERSRALRFFMERDGMTGLLNHSSLAERLSTELLRSRRTGSVLSFCLIDIDRLKAVNESHGHLAGDRVVRTAARLMSERLRRTDILGRFGGSLFAIILPGADSRTAFRLVNELREAFSALRHRGGDGEFGMTLSCGLACYPDYLGIAELVGAAERGLASAKEGGRDRVVVEHSADSAV